jgi:polysaccharide biosynthesis protein PslH
MRILLISRCPPYPLHLGDRLIVYHVARELAARGHILDLLAFTNPIEDLADRQHYANFFDHIELFPEPPRAPSSYLWRLINPRARFPERAEKAWSPEMWQAMEARLRQQSYDVVHLFGGIQVYEYHQAVRHLPAMIVPYESYSLYLRRKLDNRRWLSDMLQWFVARRYERFMFAPYRRVVVVAERDRDELLSLNPALQVEVIPNGVDLAAFQPQNTAVRETATLLFTGNYEYPPNVDAALRLAREILPRVQARYPAVKLWLVGNAPPPELQALQSERITVTGRVPDVRDYLARATVFVCPLWQGAGIKNKVLEALAIGCPVVATPLSVDGIAVQPERHALIAAEVDTLAAATIRALEDGELRQALSLNGRALVEAHYTWAEVGRRYEALYQALARRG